MSTNGLDCFLFYSGAMAEGDDDGLKSSFFKLTLEDGNKHYPIYKEEKMTEHMNDCKDGQYIHIDIKNPPNAPNGIARDRCGSQINNYMLEHFYFDPRRYHDFFDTVFEPEIPTVNQMRQVARISASYRELWKVKGNFDVCAFFNHFAPEFTGTGITIKMCLIIDNEHSLYSRTY
jgi:hypothetical protein